MTCAACRVRAGLVPWAEWCERIRPTPRQEAIARGIWERLNKLASSCEHALSDTP